MVDAVLRACGVDPVQWRALVVTAIRTDMRGPTGVLGHARTSGSFGALGTLLLIQLMSGTVAMGLVIYVRDLATAATISIAYGMFTVAVMVVLDFHTIVLSPLDYLVLGFRPISSRTYFAARVAATLFYIVAVVTAYGLPPALAIAWRSAWGFLPALAFAAGFYAASIATAYAFVLVYAGTVGVVAPHRLRYALTALQLIALTAIYAAYAVGLKLIQGGADVAAFALPDGWSVLLLPPFWYASLTSIAIGDVTAPTIAAAATGMLAVVALVARAGARISLPYAERLLQLSSVPAPPAARNGGGRSRFAHVARAVLPAALLSHEARAVMLLVGRQFRYDMKFRMALLSVIPLTLFYLFFGWNEGAVADPFSPNAPRALDMTFMVVAMMPQLFHAVLLHSDHYRAAWVFFATPADRRSLVMALKNVVTLFLVIPYLVFLATIYAFTFERVAHAMAHVVMIGLIAHCFLQFAIAVRPGLPFARPPTAGEYSASTFVVILVSSLAAGLLPTVFATFYPRPWGYAGVLGTVLLLTASLELLLFARIRKKLGKVEYSG